MLEAKLSSADLLKKVLEAVKELVTEASFDCSDEGIKLQAMDNSHVALVALELKQEQFEAGYRCDHNMSLGMNIASLQKIVKCAGNDDTVTIRADESADVLQLLFESKNSDRIGEYEMKLMDIDQEHLGIPDTVYDAEIQIPSGEFARIVRDLKDIGESVRIDATKEGVKFSSEGDLGNANVTLKPTVPKNGSDDEDEDEDEGDEDEEEEEEEEEKKKDVKPKRVEGEGDEEEDEKPTQADMDVEDDEKPTQADMDDDIEEIKPKKEKSKPNPKASSSSGKKRKAATNGKAKKGSKKAKKDGGSEEAREVKIHLQQAVSLTFSIKYLTNFAKSTPLSNYVKLSMSNEVPLLVEYDFGGGSIKFFLAPKISDE